MKARAIMSLKEKKRKREKGLAAKQLAQMTPGRLPSELQMNRHWSLSGPDFQSLFEEGNLRQTSTLQQD